MSQTSQARPLTAVDTLNPAPGEVIEVLVGEVLVFAVGSDGHRTPLCTAHHGQVIVGCDQADDGSSLLVTGLPGTEVRVTTLARGDITTEQLSTWLDLLGGALAQDRWPGSLVPIASAGSMLAPGECVGPRRDDPQLVWVRVTAGTADLCGMDPARIGPQDPALPLTHGTWLRAGLRCRIVEDSAPDTAARWADALNLWGRLTVSAVEERAHRADLTAALNRQAVNERAGAAIHKGVDLLTTAVGAKERPPVLADAAQSQQLFVAMTTARASGLTVTEDALLRAAEEVESGRDPETAIAAVADARPRPITLEAGWNRREGTPKYVQIAVDTSRTTEPRALVWRRGWVLIDSEGNSQNVDDEVAARVSRKAIEFLPVLPPQPSNLRDLARLAVRGSAREWIAVGVVTGLVALMTFFTPFLLGKLPELFTTDAPTTAYAAIFIALLLVVLAGAAWQSVRALALLRARSRSVAIASGAVWERIMRLPAPWHGKRKLGDRLNQASSTNFASGAFPDETLTQLLNTAAVFGALLAIATTGPVLLAALVVVFALQAVVISVFLRATVSRASDRITASAEASGRLIEILRAIPRLRVSGAESRAFLRWAQLQAKFAQADLSLRRITMTQGVVIAAWPVFTLIVIIAVIGVAGGTFGQFITAQTAATAATVAISSLAMSGGAAVMARQALLKTEPTLAAVPEGGGDGVQPGTLSGSIEVRDIVFRYAPDLPAVLDKVSISVHPGEHVAFVGPSGCGKTTLMRIIIGLEDAESGVLLIDGRDLSGLDRPAVRRQVGSVLQSAVLLPASIRENVAMGRTFTQDEIWAALDAAFVGDDVRALAMGLDTPVSDGGGTLSGGQRQRILIARALAGRPRVLVLDEATSALDNVTQAGIVAALDQLNITRLVVAHRLSTIRNADRIFVLEDGHLVDSGTYDELMDRPGPFRDLAARQET
jgi:ABC-type bacteriocin/lantibiotic exporter with double-glycine peptidase domain